MRYIFALLTSCLGLAVACVGCSRSEDSTSPKSSVEPTSSYKEAEKRKAQPAETTPDAKPTTQNDSKKAPAERKRKPSIGDRTLQGHRYTVCGMAFLKDGRQLLSASSDSTLRLWDLENG